MVNPTSKTSSSMHHKGAEEECAPKPNLNNCFKCTVCSAMSYQACDQCKTAHYCSTMCQRTDWKSHKALCTSFKYFKDRPHETLRRAIIFEADADTPRFIWVQFVTDAQGHDTAEAACRTLCGGYTTAQIVANTVRMRQDLEFVEMVYDGNADQNKPNKAIANLLKTAKLWSAIFIAYQDELRIQSHDLYPNNLRGIVDFLSTLGRDPKLDFNASPFFPTALMASRAHKIQGVRITAKEDEVLDMDVVWYPQDHPFIMSTLKNPPKKKELDVDYDVLHGIKLPLAWEQGKINAHIEACRWHETLGDLYNFLRYCLVPENARLFDTCGPHKQLDFTFVRGDLKDLAFEHMACIVDFCFEKLYPMVEGQQCVHHQNFDKISTQANLEAYFQQMKTNFGWDPDLKSPYDI